MKCDGKTKIVKAQVPKWISANNPPKKPGTHLVYMRYPNGQTETICRFSIPIMAGVMKTASGHL